MTTRVSRYRQFRQLLTLTAQCCKENARLCFCLMLLTFCLDEGIVLFVVLYNKRLSNLIPTYKTHAALLGGVVIVSLLFYSCSMVLLSYLWREFFRQSNIFLLLKRARMYQRAATKLETRDLEYHHVNDVVVITTAIIAALDGHLRFGVLFVCVCLFTVSTSMLFSLWMSFCFFVGLFVLIRYCFLIVPSTYHMVDKKYRETWNILCELYRANELLRERRQEENEIRKLEQLLHAASSAEHIAEDGFVSVHLLLHCIFFIGFIIWCVFVEYPSVYDFTIGSSMFALSLWLLVGWHLRKITQASIFVTRALPALKRLDRVFTLASTVHSKATLAKLGTPLSVQYTNVTHSVSRYLVLNSVSFGIESGEVVGFVGHSKELASLIRLLQRSDSACGGEIKLSAKLLSEWSQIDLDQTIAYVGQSPIVLTRSVIENLTYGAIVPIEHSAVLEMIDLLQLSDFVARLSIGLDAILDTQTLTLATTAEKQLIAIGRALLNPLPILILDRAMSAVSPSIEAAVIQYLCHKPRLQTTLILTDCLSTLHEIDRIEVFYQGRIVGSGTHYNLLNTHSYYRRLYFSHVKTSLVSQTSR